MSFDGIIGQRRPKEILAKAIEQERIPNGYLFIGPEGTGKEALAIDFAKAMFCNAMFEKPCNTCSGCRRVKEFNHPDFIYILPKPKTAKTDDVRKIFDSLVAEPYARKILWVSPTIGIDEIRELRKTVSIKPTERKRIIAIAEADKLTQEAANSLLKLLEEPPESTHFVLTTARPNTLLPTIISRCQEVKFGLLTDSQVESALLKRSEISPEKARLVSRISQGSFKRALEWTDHDLEQKRSVAIDLVRTSLRDNRTKFQLIEKVLDEYDKKSVKDMFNLMLIWFRDSLILSNNSTDEVDKIVNIDQLETLEKFTNAFNQINYGEAFEEIEKAIELIDRNVQLQLIMIVLFNRIHKILSSKG